MTGTAANPSIVQGQNASVQVQLIDQNTGNPFPLSGLTGCTGFFPKNDGTGLAVSGQLVSQDLGQVVLQLSQAMTNELNVGETQTIEVWVDQGPLRSIAQIPNAITVNAINFPTSEF